MNERNAMSSKNARALARHLEIGEGEIKATNYGSFRADRDSDYLVYTDEEADNAAREVILDQVWAFQAEFLEAHGVPAEVSEALLPLCEGANPVLLKLLRDVEHFVEDAIASDGRGHFLSMYDGQEHEVRVDGETFFIYREN